ncbi:hypothetical protein H0G86_007430 [Trichoderma simmonsii]|uniref:Uncharacterized protein n=1 Tax=Trichoderma simmonsii TaxID=1491479 RepID=A0A8G0LDG8_9HYPO|nr:hypothetical protein H0G86_007430 [Trichoderma simmonsii]
MPSASILSPQPWLFSSGLMRMHSREIPSRNTARETPQAPAARFRNPARLAWHFFHTHENDAARADTRHVRHIRHVSTSALRECSLALPCPDLQDEPIDSA